MFQNAPLVPHPKGDAPADDIVITANEACEFVIMTVHGTQSPDGTWPYCFSPACSNDLFNLVNLLGA